MARGGGDDDVVAAVDAGVGGAGGEHGLEQDEEAAAVVAADGEVEVAVGVEDDVGEGIVDEGDELLILRAVLDPEGVELDGLIEGPEQGQDVDDLGGVGGEIGLVDGGGELGRRGEVEREGDVLGEVEAGVGEVVVVM